MDIEKIREYCLAKKAVSESFPFNDTALVFKVLDKMFALLDLSLERKRMSLKCEPELAIKLREKFPEVTPGYHFNKKHWNTIDLEGKILQKEIEKWIDHSYDLVVSKLTKADKEKLANL